MTGAWIAAAGVGCAAAGLIIRRCLHYRSLASDLRRVLAQHIDFNLTRAAPDFTARLATIGDFLPVEQFAAFRREAEALAGAERSYVPAHKKGGTIAYETLIVHAPGIVRFYHSAAMRALVSRVVGAEVRPTPIQDQSSLSVLVYERPGDHIGWHYDHNFYRGRHFTLLLPLVNTGNDVGGVSHARLSAWVGGHEQEIAAAPNTLALFEGARVRHKVSALAAGERRVVLSMTYCADPRASLAQGIARRLKDTAFYGVRALWT